jgi:cysteine-rich secretory family protein
MLVLRKFLVALIPICALMVAGGKARADTPSPSDPIATAETALLDLESSQLDYVQRASLTEWTSFGPEYGLETSINSARHDAGLSQLSEDPRLVLLARARSQDMANRHYFAHVSPDGLTIFSILDDSRVPWWSAGENLAESRGYDPVQFAINGFMKSPPHRANVLNSHYQRIGVGQATSSDGMTILTVVFTN